MTNMNDFEKVLMAANENLKAMQNLTQEKKDAKLKCYQNKYNEIRKELMNCGKIFKNLSVSNKELTFTFEYDDDVQLDTEDHVKLVKTYNDGIIFLGVTELRFDMEEYSMCKHYSQINTIKGYGLNEYKPEWVMENWSNIREAFLTAFQDALIEMMGTAITNEEYNYTYAKTKLEEAQIMMG